MVFCWSEDFFSFCCSTYFYCYFCRGRCRFSLLFPCFGYFCCLISADERVQNAKALNSIRSTVISHIRLWWHDSRFLCREKETVCSPSYFHFRFLFLFGVQHQFSRLRFQKIISYNDDDIKNCSIHVLKAMMMMTVK